MSYLAIEGLRRINDRAVFGPLLCGRGVLRLLSLIANMSPGQLYWKTLANPLLQP
jgi:hypothetical protein